MYIYIYSVFIYTVYIYYLYMTWEHGLLDIKHHHNGEGVRYNFFESLK